MSGKGRTSCRTFVCDAANRPEPDLVVTRGELVTMASAIQGRPLSPSPSWRRSCEDESADGTHMSRRASAERASVMAAAPFLEAIRAALPGSESLAT